MPLADAPTLPAHPQCICYWTQVTVDSEQSDHILDGLAADIRSARAEFVDIAGPVMAEQFERMLLGEDVVLPSATSVVRPGTISPQSDISVAQREAAAAAQREAAAAAQREAAAAAQREAAAAAQREAAAAAQRKAAAAARREAAAAAQREAAAAAQREAAAAAQREAAAAAQREAAGTGMRPAIILEADGEVAQKHLRHYDLIPVGLRNAVESKGVKIYINNDKMMPDIDDRGEARDVQPRGWPAGMTWNDVPGAYSRNDRYVIAGNDHQRGHGSVSCLLHEYGHAVGHVLDYDNAPELIEAHIKHFQWLQPYYQQGGAGSYEGRQEFFAEAFAQTLMDRDRAIWRYGEDVVSLIENVVLKESGVSQQPSALPVSPLDERLRRLTEEQEGLWRQLRKAKSAKDDAEIERIRSEDKRLTEAIAAINRPPEGMETRPAVILEADGDVAQYHLKHYDLIPSALRGDVESEGVKTYINNDKMMPDIDRQEAFKNIQPRGWPAGMTWNDVPGAYNRNDRYVIAGGDQMGHGSVSLLLHEYGHAVGHVLDYDNAPELIEAHVKQFSILQPYYQQGGAGAYVGRQEFFAEAFAQTLVDRRKAVVLYGQDVVSFIENVVSRGRREALS